jgi:hypothetical protein
MRPPQRLSHPDMQRLLAQAILRVTLHGMKPTSLEVEAARAGLWIVVALVVVVTIAAAVLIG